MRYPANPYEVEPEPCEPLPKDAQGKTISPRNEDLLEQLRKLRELANQQLAERRWSQR